MLDLFDVQLKRTKALSESLNFHPIFILIPDRHQVDKKLRKAKCEYYGIQENEVNIDLANESLRPRFDDYEMPYVDVLDCLRGKLDSEEDEKLYYTLDNHLTSEGHRAAYMCMKNEINRVITGFLQNQLINGK